MHFYCSKAGYRRRQSGWVLKRGGLLKAKQARLLALCPQRQQKVQHLAQQGLVSSFLCLYRLHYLSVTATGLIFLITQQYNVQVHWLMVNSSYKTSNSILTIHRLSCVHANGWRVCWKYRTDLCWHRAYSSSRSHILAYYYIAEPTYALLRPCR